MCIQEELHLLNHDLQLKLDETGARDASSAKDLEEVTQQLVGWKTIFLEKVSIMYISCSEKDVSARQLEDEVSILHLSLRENDAQINELEIYNASPKHDVLFH